MNKGWITRIQRFSVHDGPGIRTTIFLKGCPLACVWCHNPENISEQNEVLYEKSRCAGCGKCLAVCPQGCFKRERNNYFDSSACDRCGLCIENCPVGALQWSGRELTANEIVAEAGRDQVYYEISGGGITISGGEPLHQPDFCREIAARAKELGLHIALDTSGSVGYERFEVIIPLVDLFLYDIKFIDARAHTKYSGKDNCLILDNFKRLCATGRPVIVRVPLIAGLTDSQENLAQISDFVAKWGNGAPIERIPFNPLMKEKYRLLGRTETIK